MQAIDFFSGAGGLTKGLSLAKINVLAGLDIDPNFRKTYLHNNPNSIFIESNIMEISPQELLEYISVLKIDDSDLLFAGCAPCQAFSQQRNQDLEKRQDEEALTYFGKLVEYFLPGQVFVENVRGLGKTQIFKDFLHLLQKNKYSVWSGVLNARDFGVAQIRWRLVLIAMRGVEVIKPIPTHGIGHKPHNTVLNAISHFPPIKAGETHSDIPNHIAANLSELNFDRIRNTPKNGGGRESWPEELKLKCHRRVDGYTDIYGRMSWKDQSPTITCRCNSLSNGRYGHPEQDRAISLREAAALQSFPDNYEFFGNNGSVAKQIGNAVPVEMAKALGEHILNLRNNPNK